MKLTINQLRLELADIQSSHLQLSTFFWGDFARAVNEESINYPLMCSYFPSAGLLDNQTTLPLTIVIADKTYSDFSNLNDVESDCLQICRDIFNIMNKSARWQKIGRVDSCSLTKFIESEADVCAGYVMTVNFVLRDSNSICDLPLSGYDFDQDIASSCLPVQIFRNGVLVDTIPSGGMYSYTTDSYTYTIRNTITTLYSGNVVSNLDVEVQDSSISITNSLGVELYNVLIPAEDSTTQAIGDAKIENTDLSYQNSVTAEGYLQLPDIKVTVENSNNIAVNNGIFPSVIDVTISAPDGHVHIKKQNDGSIINQAVASGETIIYSVADSTAVVKNSAGTTLSTDTIHATESKNIVVPDITFTDSNGSTSSVASGVNITATACTTPIGARLMKTGQTVSYQSGDDGTHQAGRLVSFYVLASNNPFGNTNRFTDELGGQTYTKGIMIDWAQASGSTVQGYYFNDGNYRSWSSFITWANALSITGFTSGWRPVNKLEIETLFDYGASTFAMNYAPLNSKFVINGGSNRYFWCSNSYPNGTGSSFVTDTYNWGFNISSKGNTQLGFAIRTFTVTGTTLS